MVHGGYTAAQVAHVMYRPQVTTNTPVVRGCKGHLSPKDCAAPRLLEQFGMEASGYD